MLFVARAFRHLGALTRDLGATRAVIWVGMVAMVLMGVWMPPFFDWAHEAAASLTALAGR